MWWQKDDLADKLIANNAARPRPGMEKPDRERLRINAPKTPQRGPGSQPEAVRGDRARLTSYGIATGGCAVYSSPNLVPPNSAAATPRSKTDAIKSGSEQ